MRRPSVIWDDIQSSLWFLSGLLTFAGGVMAWVVLRFDTWRIASEMDPLSWTFGGGADSARQILSTIAGSMITITGVTFSMTMVALVLAAGQYSPRVLRTFTRDRTSQVVLGVFVGTFVYTLLILRSIRGGDDAYVPAVGVTLAILLAIVSLGLFLLFIHHIATSIQASSLIENVARETLEEIERLFSDDVALVGPARGGSSTTPLPAEGRIATSSSGYIQSFDTGALVRAATEAGACVDLRLGPGDFVSGGVPIAVVSDPAAVPALEEALESALSLGHQRTVREDPAYGFRQLIDIAVKALSPGINDPTTASNAVDHLGSLLAAVADRDWPESEFRDEEGEVRLRVPGAAFGDYVELACSQIRHYARDDRPTLGRLLDALGQAALVTEREDRLGAIWREALEIAATGESHIESEPERRRLRAQLGRLAAELGRELPDPGEEGY